MNKEKIVYDCDLFCIEPFVYDGVVRITGNFYATNDVVVKGLEVGGDIILMSPDFDNPSVIDAEYILCNGNFYSEDYEQTVMRMSIGEQMLISMSGPVQFE